MIKRSEMQRLHQSMIQKSGLGSHSTLEIMDGAKMNFETVVYCQKGRKYLTEI